MVKTSSGSMKDLEVLGRSRMSSEVGVTDMSSKRKKKSKRLTGRSKSLTDTSSSSKPFFSDDSRNVGRHGQPYLRRIPTQDDIYKILSETSDIRRPSTSTGGQKILSPYEPLPAIGEKFKPINNSDDEVSESRDSISVTSNDDNAQKLTREGTYNVLKPKFVKGPVVSFAFQNTDGRFKEIKQKKEEIAESQNQLKQSSGTAAFGPRLPKEDENVIEGDPAATQLQGNTSLVVPSNSEVQDKKSESSSQAKNFPMQKLYHRDKEKTDIRRLAISLIGVSGNEGAHDKPKAQNALWFD